MAGKASRAQARQDLIRLLAGLEYYRSWRIAQIKAARGVVTADDLAAIVEPGSSFLEYFDAARGAAFTQIVDSVQQWYSHTASDLGRLASSGDAATADAVRRFLDNFRRDVGFGFHSESGTLGRTAEKVLCRNRVENFREYYALRELETDLSQRTLAPERLARVAQLLRKFEESHPAD